jgi:poly-beta-1,6-N-acetyl-D-glucosamine synthase
VTDRATPKRNWRVVMLIPAYNEEESIERTLRAACNQDYAPDAIVVMANNCKDDTAEVARSVPGVTVVEMPDEPHKKAGALNKMYHRYREDTDFFVCIDADTILPPDSVRLWVLQMEKEPNSAGISARFTMQPQPGAPVYVNFLTRMQKHEFAGWTDKALNRGGHTSVLAGTANCLRVEALDELVDLRLLRDGYEHGPWYYGSLVEDYDLTYELRQLGWDTKVSYEVRAYTEAMSSLRTLYAQRMKWQTGTLEDLVRQGVTRFNYREWGVQVQALLMTAFRLLWLTVMVLFAVFGVLTLQWFWILLPLFFAATDVKRAWRVPHRDYKDVLLAASFFPLEAAAWMHGFLTTMASKEVLVARLTGKRKDRWEMQMQAERGRAGAGVEAIPTTERR